MTDLTISRRRALLGGGAAAVVAAVGIQPAGAATTDPVGSYAGVVTAVDPPLGSFVNLMSLIPAGIVIESRRYLVDAGFGKLLETTGHGAWRTESNGAIIVTLQFLLQDLQTTNSVGTDNITLTLTADRQGNLAGVFSSKVLDESGNVLLSANGTYRATRTPSR